MKKILFFIFLYTNILVAWSEQQVLQHLSPLVQKLKQKSIDLSLMAKPALDNSFAIEIHPDAKKNPASTVKLITSLAALHYLGPQYRFKTKYSLLHTGDLLIEGFGDPTLHTKKLQEIASILHEKGVKTVQNIILEDAFFDPIQMPKGFEEEENPQKAYAAPVGALSLNYNVLTLKITPKACGAPAHVEVIPAMDITLFQNLKTVCGKQRSGVRVEFHENDSLLALDILGKVNKRKKSYIVTTSVPKPSLYFAMAFKKQLQLAGVQVQKGILLHTKKSAKTLLSHTDFSPPLTEIVMDLNQFSNNFIAEMLVKAIGARFQVPASFDSGLSAMRRFLKDQVGILPGEYILGNGSGLNHSNQFTARQMVQILTYAAKEFPFFEDFKASLALPGKRGTLRHRFNLPKNRVTAKTGTLKGVSALTGYVMSPDQEMIAFAIMLEKNSKKTSYPMKKAEDEVIKWLSQMNVKKPPA